LEEIRKLGEIVVVFEDKIKYGLKIKIVRIAWKFITRDITHI